jgi:MFS family permease
VPHLLVFTVEASLQELPHLVGPALAAMTVALAFGWMTAATTAGAALVLPLAGSLLDRAGPGSSRFGRCPGHGVGYERESRGVRTGNR